MAGGINALICLSKDKRQIIQKMMPYGSDYPSWISNRILSPIDKEGSKLLSGEIDIEEYIIDKERKGKIELRQAIGFAFNGKSIKFEELYPNQCGKSGYSVVFLKRNDGLELLILGSKTSEEFKKIGANNQHSFVPLVITDQLSGRKKVLTSVNL